MSSVAVVLLNWNGLNHLQEYLPQVVKATGNIAEIVIIDNHSTDESINWVNKHFPEIRCIVNDKNYGFAGGYNKGLTKVKAEVYVLMNTDVRPESNYLDPVLNLFNSNPLIAACQPKIKAIAQPDFFEYAGAAGGFIDKDGFAFCRGRIFDTVEHDSAQYNDNRPIFWATGACLFIRSVDFWSVGGFDEDFFAHMEEIDLCWRLKNRGRQIWYCGESTIYHLGGGTLSYQNNLKAYLNFRNNLFLLYKNHRNSPLFFKLFRRLFIDGIAAIRALFSGKPVMLWVVLKAHFAFYGALGTLRKKRKTMVIESPDKTGVYKRSVVFDYFIRKKKHFTDLEF
ncbi:MAG: glycosyltransferase family 2 protein [Flavobacteriales bacterium]